MALWFKAKAAFALTLALIATPALAETCDPLKPALSGAAWTDRNGDGVRNAGEGRNDLTIKYGLITLKTNAEGQYAGRIVKGPLSLYPTGGGLTGDRLLRVDLDVARAITMNVIDGNTIEISDNARVWNFGGTVRLICPGRIETSTGTQTLIGSDGDDVLIGGWGDDTLVGGAGNDVAAGYGKRGAYTVATAGEVTTVRGGTEGTDTLTGIETLRFVDGDVAIASALVPTPAPQPTPNPTPTPEPPPVLISGYTVDAKAQTITFRGFGFPSFTLPLVVFKSIYEKHIAP